MRRVVLLFLFLISSIAYAEDELFFVKVSDPYVEVHTGPGRGYPIFYTVARGDWIEILFRQTDWYKVKTEQGQLGWVSAAELSMTLNPSGKRVDIKDPNEDDFKIRNWEYGVLLGNFEGAAVMTAYGAYRFTENISTEISLSQAIGDASSITLIGGHLVHEPFPEWKVSPFFRLGTGRMTTKPKSTTVVTSDRTDNFAHYGFGVRMHLTKRFLLRAEYNSYVTFTSRNESEDIGEWKAGFGFFF